MPAATGLGTGLGEILGSGGAFGRTKYTPVHVIKGQGKYDRLLQDQQQNDINFYNDWLSKFTSGTSDAIGRVDTERPIARSDLQSLFDKNQTYDPWSGPTTYQNTIFKNYTDLAKSIPDWTTKNLDLNAFNLGMGGRPSSSYYAPAISRTIAAQLFPSIASGVSTIPSLAGTAEAGKNANLASLLDIINRRTGTATAGMDLPLAPIAARTGTRNAESAALQALNAAAQSGIAGWQAVPDTVTKLANFATALGQGSGDTLGSIEGSAGEGSGGAPAVNAGNAASPSAQNWYGSTMPAASAWI